MTKIASRGEGSCRTFRDRSLPKFLRTENLYNHSTKNVPPWLSQNQSYAVVDVTRKHQTGQTNFSTTTYELQARKKKKPQSKETNHTIEGLSNRACKCYVTAQQPAKLVLNNDSIPYKSMLGDCWSTEKRLRTCPIPNIFWNVTH